MEMELSVSVDQTGCPSTTKLPSSGQANETFSYIQPFAFASRHV